jgi:hypothetical protein
MRCDEHAADEAHVRNCAECGALIRPLRGPSTEEELGLADRLGRRLVEGDLLTPQTPARSLAPALALGALLAVLALGIGWVIVLELPPTRAPESPVTPADVTLDRAGLPHTPPSPRIITPPNPRVIPVKGDFRPEEAVLLCLLWLARHQEEDGSWSVTGYVNQCEGEKKCAPVLGSDDLNVGVTGLCLLAFLGAGYTHLSRDTYRGIVFGEVVRKGIQHLMRIQQPDGSLGPAGSPRETFQHVLATFALVEAYGLTSSMMLKDAAQKAVDRLCALRRPGAGWGEPQGPDAIVTCWAASALWAARQAELDFPRDTLTEVLRFLETLTNPDTRRVGYRTRGRDGGSIPGRNDHFTPHPTCTAAAAVAKMLLTPGSRPESIAPQVDLVASRSPGIRRDSRDGHHEYWASFAVYLADGPKGSAWKAWNSGLKQRVLNTQQRTDSKVCTFGSWEADDKWSCEAGRVYVTAINALTLEVYYRYPNVFIEKGK